MKRRNLWLCVLACLLAVGLLAACSKKDPASSETTGENPSTTGEVTEEATDAVTTAGEEETTSEPETYPEINLPTDPAGVMELIDSISEGNLDSEWDIDRAYAAWAALSEDARAEVTNYDKLRDLLQQVADAHIVKEYKDRIPHGELLLGAYYGPTPTDDKLQVAVDAYLDFFCGVSNDQATLDQYKKFGLGAFVTGTSFGVPNYHVSSNWAEEGWQSVAASRTIRDMELMLQSVAQVAAKDHEAIWGMDYIDEPGAGAFWIHDYVLDATNKVYSQIQTFANLLPNYGSPTQLGMYSYGRYIRDYAVRVGGDILSIDHYMYDTNVRDGQKSLLRGLEELHESTKDAGKDIMIILQINRNNNDRLTTLGEIKFQAYASMAYGAKYLIWACYNGGWYNTQALDENQQPTEQYYKMQECNADIKTLSPVFMRYTAMDQTFLNATPLREFLSARHPLGAMGIKTITDLTASESTSDLLMGYFEKNVGEGEAFLFVNTSTFDQKGSNTETSTVSFRTVSPASVVTAYVKGIPTILTPVDGVYTFDIVDADAVFVTVTEPASLNSTPVAPVGQITIGGTDISEFSIVIPSDATERERQAAEALVDIIEQATFKTLPIVTDAETPAHAIVLGKTALSTTALNTAVSTLTNDGYAILTEGGNLYISGNDAAGAGTLFGVYAFCENYLNIGFYADDFETIPTAATIAVADGITATHNPSFIFRDSTNYIAMDQAYPLYQKYNGYSVFGDINFGATQFGGYALNRLCGVNENYVQNAVCLSNESTYATALANAKAILGANPNSEYLGCDIGLGGEWTPCSCSACTAGVAAKGVMGFTMEFANRLAGDLKADYPSVQVVITAAGENIALPATVRPADNVAVRVVMPRSACRFHALGDDSCEVNAEFCAALEAWAQVCDHVILLDQVTERTTSITDYQKISGNLLALYDTIQYLKSLGVVGYQQMGYDSYAGEFEALNAYLLSRLLWDADMTREEYSAEMDGFLKAYYGEGGTYVRQYIDKVYTTEGIMHSDYKDDFSMMFRTDDKAFGLSCLEFWVSAIDAADTAEIKKNAEHSAVQLHSVAQASRDRTYSGYFRNLLVKYGYATS